MFFCGHSKTIVLNSLGREDFSKIVRRRCCPKCQKRATTFEVMSDHKNKKNITLIAHYDCILQQLHSLEKPIQKLHNVFLAKLIKLLFKNLFIDFYINILLFMADYF